MKIYKQMFSDQREIENWDRIYDQQNFNGDCYRQRMGTVLTWLEDLDLLEYSSILEAGCGAGRFSYEAVQRGCHVFGLDYSYGMAVKANSTCNRSGKLNSGFLQGDIESLPLKDSSFDVIVCLGVVAYLKSEEKVLTELARVLKPGGILAISIVNKARLANRLDLALLLVTQLRKIRKVITGSHKKRTSSDNDFSLTTFFIPTFQASLQRAGFTVLEYKTTPWKLLTFCGKETLPIGLASRTTLFFEKFSNLPFVGSFGGMCVFKAQKNSLDIQGIRSLAPLGTDHFKGGT